MWKRSLWYRLRNFNYAYGNDSYNGGYEMKQWFKEFIHNCLVHPVLPFIPREMSNRLHQWHGDWTFGVDELAGGE